MFNIELLGTRAHELSIDYSCEIETVTVRNAETLVPAIYPSTPANHPRGRRSLCYILPSSRTHTHTHIYIYIYIYIEGDVLIVICCAISRYVALARLTRTTLRLVVPLDDD